ncbi:hypothetical protein Nepgr_021154 [Nepenthes gracilis]|uniref:Uncharacterized protein n=1 Tax=Nepenthes gracilis TaxID=150966 RepID=A0AAD3SXM9_NEPGR|nr:hypothetical protein Nepgr_021154 [Nepenthes gracilis]
MINLYFVVVNQDYIHKSQTHPCFGTHVWALTCSLVAVLDCSASPDTIEVLKKVVEIGCCIVLANKRLVTSSMIFTQFPH